MEGASMAHSRRSTAVVIGGKHGGLTAARVLADHFNAVTVLERTTSTIGPRCINDPTGLPSPWALLGGQQVMASLYPGFIKKLETLGAEPLSSRHGRRILSPDGQSVFR